MTQQQQQIYGSTDNKTQRTWGSCCVTQETNKESKGIGIGGN